MPDSVLPTKLFIPSSRPELVPRPKLIKQLDNGLHRTLTLISAPAGFGKTTQVAEWVDSLKLEDARARTAWLSLDEADNDLGRFLTYFFTSIIRSEVMDQSMGKTAFDLVQASNSTPIETIFTPLISELSTIKKNLIIVLDDYHLIESPPIHRAMNFWLDNAPPQIHTVVITREDPPFPLARLRAKNQLTELRAADLRFSEDEATRFLNDIMGLHLDAGSITLLEERTEGWAAGLQMAALSMRDRKDTVGFIENFSGTNRYILDYLLEEVLANQAIEIQQFLLRTSILRSLTAPLCDAVLDVRDEAVSILAYLEQANLFLVPMDDHRVWYRYHHLFTDLLRARLQQTVTKQELAELHTRAARWYEHSEMAYGAIYHASLVPDDEWVERLIDQNYMEIFQRKDSISIRNWTGELSKELIAIRPRLAIHEANSRAWFGQLDDANYLLDAAEKRLLEEPSTPETEAMFGYLAYVKSRVTAMCGDFEQAIQLGVNAFEKTPASNLGLLGGIGVMLGYGYFLNGDFSKAIQILEETIQTGKKTRAINTTIGAICVLGRLYAIQGMLQKAFELYKEAEKFISQSEGQHRGAMSIVDVGFAEIMYEWNDLEAAQEHIQQAQEFLPLWSKADDTALAHVVCSQILQAQGDQEAAEINNERGSHIIQSSGVFPEARDAVINAELHLHLGDQYAVSRWAKSVEKRLLSENPFRFENELVLIGLVRAHLAQKEYTEGLDLLSDLEASAQSGGRLGRLIKILSLQALLLDQQGETTEAFSTFSRALTLAEPEGYVRTFLDEGQSMNAFLNKWLAQIGTNPLKGYAGYLAAQFNSGAGQERDLSEGELIDPLSPREIEVLQHIAQGKTNNEISEELIVSPGTVKAHTSSIYRKLDVTNRTEAVARARELNILS